MQTLPARADPDSPNSQPHYPDHFQVAGQSGAKIVLAKVLVLEDGAVGDAIVSGSSGISELDAENTGTSNSFHSRWLVFGCGPMNLLVAGLEEDRITSVPRCVT
jgi:hypothetical protein